MMKKFLDRFMPVALVLVLAFLLVACGKDEPTATPVAVTTAAQETTRSATTTTAKATPTIAKETTRAATTAAVKTTTAVPKTTVAQNEPDLTATFSEKTVIRTFTNPEGQKVRLVYGRGTGHGGDYGWAHILGKHVNGIWYDGGTITTFPKTAGTKNPSEVIDLINKSIQDKNPDQQNGGRLGYVYAIPGTKYDVFTVVGSDGTIITSYPVPHGSKDEDS